MFAIIFLASPDFYRECFPLSRDKLHIVREGLKAGKYIATAPIDVGALLAADAAEEMFDLANNPSRQEEREEKYGRGRSLSTGDIVCVNGEMFVCCSVGWEKI